MATNTTIEHTTFRNPDMYWDIAADIYYPPHFDAHNSYPTIVSAHPIGSCKEQTSGNIYASALAEAGNVVIAFDASFQGASGGTPRFIEDPAQRVEDFRRVADYLTTLPYVDADRIGVLGVCGGGGYTLNAAMTEKRFKAVASITGVNYGRMMRETQGSNDAVIAALEAAATQRTKEARGADSAVAGMLPDSKEAAHDVGDIDIVEAYDYYRTERGESPNGCVLFENAHGASALGWDAFHLADTLLTQPLLVIVGDKQGAFGAYRDGHDIIRRAASKDKKLIVLENVSHYDLYDQPHGAGEALKSVIPFFAEHL
ncbi:alpha/beta hydrolase [Gordonia sp. KTR9]|uniref:alpha/beta hydrolase n=1 Tax=Gordonia sp. KTR9 TaxID=337191 RepID=UPI00027DDF66|nr:alpha/beta hydrolase [Gordonia sp. KTR9]AFR49518.1 Hydrolase, alpha/beta superfamily [Gordonia sp. KTR9]